MTLISKTVAASLDDARERTDDTSFNNSGSALWLFGGTLGYHSGARWPTWAIPAGATIDASTLYVWATGLTADDAAIDITGELVDSPPQFNDATTDDVTSRKNNNSTSASVYWDELVLGDSAYADSPEIKTILQELVDDANWDENDAIVIFMATRVTPVRNLQIHSWDGVPSKSPKLEVTFTSGLVGRRAVGRGVFRGVGRGVM